ncbi:MAG: PQQ-binding-like beta-propeller repeat protein [Bacteroidota bacterium]|nr:PQQ-binding-like beta-propeller repeat protein [Bacteroidota bacterium]
MKPNTFRQIQKIASIFIFTIMVLSASAGGPAFRELHKARLPFSPSIQMYNHTDDFRFFLCSSKTEILMFDGTTGKILWKKNFEKDFSNKKFLNQYWNKDANVVLVFDEDTKKNIATKYFIDGRTGNLLWKSDKYISGLGGYDLGEGFSNYYDIQTNGVLLPTKESVNFVDVNTGNIIWSKPITISGKGFDCFFLQYYNLVKIVNGGNGSYYTIDKGNEVTEIEPYFNRKKFLANQLHSHIIEIPGMYILMLTESVNSYKAFTGIDLPKLDMSFMGYDAKTDNLLWSKVYHINCAFNWVNKKEFFARMYYDGERLFVEHNPGQKPNTGLTVINPVNGELLWEANFKASDVKTAGLGKNILTPFPAPHPVTVDGKTYVVNKAKNIVSCYDATNGTKIWDSEDFPDAQKIPSLIYADGMLIMNYGGGAKKCATIIKDKGPNVERYEYNNKDKYGINAYDAATGKIVWNDKTLKKQFKVKFGLIAGTEMINGNLVCATDRDILVIDPKTGNVLKNISISDEKLGDAWSMVYFPEKGKIILNCEDGIIKMDAVSKKFEGKVKITTFPFFMPYEEDKMNADDPWSDYAVFTKGDGEKMVIKEFASIDLDNMTVRAAGDADVFTYRVPHFSEGGEMFYKSDGDEVTIFSVK